MKAMFFALVALCLVNCKYEVGNPVEIRIDGDFTDQDGMRDMFTAQVAEASMLWRDALEGCIDPFPLDGDGESLPITLYVHANWKYGSAFGYTPADYIEINGPIDGEPLNDMVNVILHEMGHVMRLHHNNDNTSVMGPRNARIPNQHDINEAKAWLGCTDE